MTSSSPRDRLIDRSGTQRPRFERWAATLSGDLRDDHYDAAARAVAAVGTELLGLPADARQATSGEEDAYWELPSPRRVLSCEVELAPKARTRDKTTSSRPKARLARSRRNLRLHRPEDKRREGTAVSQRGRLGTSTRGPSASNRVHGSPRILPT